MAQTGNVTGAEMAFGTTRFLPDMSEIPEEFKRGDNVWTTIVSTWFFEGYGKVMEQYDLIMLDGATQDETEEGFKRVAATLRSWEPKREHKEAGAAYMMSKLFKDAVPKTKKETGDEKAE